MTEVRSSIVLGCGGSGCNIVNRIRKTSNINALTVNWDDSDVNLAPEGVQKPSYLEDPDGARKIVDSNAGRISDMISGYGSVIAVSGPGGGAGTLAMPMISKCARSAGSAFLSVLVVPFKFEEDRRSKVISELGSMAAVSDRVIVMDMQRLVEVGGTTLMMTDVLEAAEAMIKNAVINLVRLLERTPFFSTMTQKVYSFSYDSMSSEAESIRSAMGHPMFNLDPAEGKAIICCDSEISDGESEIICGQVTDRTGIRPEMISGTGHAGHGVTVFMPISFRRHE